MQLDSRINLAGSIVLAVIAALTFSAGSTAAEVGGSAAFEQQRKAPTAEKASIVNSEPKITSKGYVSAKYQMFDIQFDDWQPDHLHWNTPSNMAIQSDGSWFIYAKHLANMRRLGGIFDTGAVYATIVNVTFYNGPLNAQKQCTGSVVHSRDYSLRSLDYKEEAWDVTSRGVDQDIARIAGQVKCGSFTRWWR